MNPCHLFRRPRAGFCLLAALAPAAAWAVTHAGLLGDARMDAKHFANNFQSFEYEYHPEVQPVDDFLESQRGDCDDYAILADEVLTRRHFHTMLVHIRLGSPIAHVVCYVVENKAYLDYNNRNVFFTLSRSGASLREIAAKVADSLEVEWTSASVFTYSYETNAKKLVRTVVKTDPPEKDGAADSSASRLLVE